MTSAIVKAGGLPEAPLDAAAAFHARIVPDVRIAMPRNRDIAIIFDPADHTHHAWRLAAIQELAREAAPCRINGVVASRSDFAGLAQVLNFVHANEGVTGQVLTVG